MKTQPNDTVKPIVATDQSAIIEYGLTKREYFAAMAMQGLLASGQYSRGLEINPGIGFISCSVADDLITALNETQS